MSLNAPTLQAIALLLASAACSYAQYPDTLWVPVTYYDFHANGSNPNFEPRTYQEVNGGLKKGMVRDTLSPDRKPLLRANLTFNNRLNEWYRPSGIGAAQVLFNVDPVTYQGTWTNLVAYLGRANQWVGPSYRATDSMANVVIYDSLAFTLLDVRKGLYHYEDTLFVPLGSRGFGAEPDSYPRYHWYNTGRYNYSFTMEMHRAFTYRPGLSFHFSGDDDVWAFVNDSLVMDIGGIHAELADSINMGALGIAPGTVCSFDFFFAERHVSASHLKIIANLLHAPQTVITLMPVATPTHERRPLLCWHPGEYSIRYTVQASTSPTFTSVLFTTNRSDTAAVPGVDLPLGTIYWRARADNSFWSDNGSFEILDPRIPIAIPYAPDPTIERRPVLTWHPAPAGPASYTVQVSTSPLFATFVATASASDTACTLSVDLPYDTLYWRVASNLLAAWSGIDTFVVLPDSVPRLVVYNGATLDVSRPAFAWHPVGGASGYRLQYANNSRFFQATTVNAVDTFDVAGQDLVNTKWFWRVSCSRDYGLWSAVDSFVVAAVVGVTSRAPAQVEGRLSVQWVDLFDVSGRRVGRAAVDQRGQVMAVAGRLDRGVPMGLYLADGPACRKLVRAGGER